MNEWSARLSDALLLSKNNCIGASAHSYEVISQWSSDTVYQGDWTFYKVFVIAFGYFIL